MCWRCGVVHDEVARLHRGVTVREEEASAHGTDVYHARRPITSTWHGTCFAARNKVERERACEL
jgi:hypothetical protein